MRDFDDKVLKERLNADLDSFLQSEALDPCFGSSEQLPRSFYVLVGTRRILARLSVAACVLIAVGVGFHVISSVCHNNRDIDIIAQQNTSSGNNKAANVSVSSDSDEGVGKFFDIDLVNAYSDKTLVVIQPAIDKCVDFSLEEYLVPSKSIVNEVQEFFNGESENTSETVDESLTQEKLLASNEVSDETVISDQDGKEDLLIDYLAMCSENSLLGIEPFVCALSVLLAEK